MSSDPYVRLLQQGVQEILHAEGWTKAKFDQQVKVSSGKKPAKKKKVKKKTTSNWPVRVKRTAPKPDIPRAASWDVEAIKICFVLHNPEDHKFPPVSVDSVGPGGRGHFPPEVSEVMHQKVMEAWVDMLENPLASWCLLDIFQWTDENFLKLLGAVPSSVEMYEGVNPDGSTGRRFTIPSHEPSSVTKEAPKLERPPETPEEQAAREAREAEHRRKREARIRQKEREREEEAEKKRLHAMDLRERGIEVPRARIQKSKKQQKLEADAKKKQGKRMRRYLSAPSKKDQALAGN